MSTLCRLNAMKHHETLQESSSWERFSISQCHCFCLKALELRNGERCMDSKFKSHDAQLNNIHGDCWYFQQLYARISRKQPPWRPGAVLSMDRSRARRSGGLGSGFHHWTTQALLEWNESQVSMQLEERLNFVGSLQQYFTQCSQTVSFRHSHISGDSPHIFDTFCASKALQRWISRVVISSPIWFVALSCWAPGRGRFFWRQSCSQNMETTEKTAPWIFWTQLCTRSQAT